MAWLAAAGSFWSRASDACADLGAVFPLTQLPRSPTGTGASRGAAGDDCRVVDGRALARLQLQFVAALFSLVLTSSLAAGLWFGRAAATEGGRSQCEGRHGGSRETELANAQREHISASDPCFHAIRAMDDKRPYKAITGKAGHDLPRMYGKVREQTIWSYWYDPESCVSRATCELPAHIQLCTETVERNKGSFDYRLVLRDEVSSYVNMMELPLHWHLLRPAQQKEALMTALLARYGGVALDVSAILFEPLDGQWAAMVAQGGTLRGLAYRVNGEPWDRPEVTAPWFFMSRREGVFSTAVLNQVTGMCTAYLHPRLPLADRVVTPVLSSLYDLPRCSEDSTVTERRSCPELSRPPMRDRTAWPLRNDRLVSLADPRDGPQLPYALDDDASMGLWRVADEAAAPGAGCGSMRECWRLFEARRRGGRLSFVKLFRTGGRLWLKTRQELLADKGTYFYNWLLVAGMSEAQLSSQLDPVVLGSAPELLRHQASAQAGHGMSDDGPSPSNASSAQS